MIEPAHPSTAQWVVACVAGALVVGVSAVLLLRVAWSSASSLPRRVAGASLAVLGLLVLLCTAVLVGAGVRAAGLGLPPVVLDEPFAARLIDVDPDVTEDVARYGTALLVPMGLLLGTVAIAVLRLGTTGTRVVGAAVSGVCLAAVGTAIAGDAGAIVTNLALVVGAVAVVGIVALIADELTSSSA